MKWAGMENKGFGWSSMKYSEDCRIAVSANRLAWIALWVWCCCCCSKRRAFWEWIGGVCCGSRAKVGLKCGGDDDDRAGQGQAQGRDGLSAR